MVKLKSVNTRTFELLKKHFWKMLGYVLLVSLISISINYINAFVFESFAVSILGYLIELYISTVMGIGLYKIMIKADDEEDFGVNDLFSFVPRFKECLIAYGIQLMFAFFITLLFSVFGVILFMGDLGNLYGAYPFISNNFMASMILSLIPKLLFFIIFTMIITIICEIFPVMAMFLAAKEDKMFSKNLFTNTFSLGVKFIKPYLLLNLIYLGICILMIIPFFILLVIGIGAETLFGAFLTLFITVAFICAFIFLSVYFSLAIVVLLNKSLNIEIAKREELFNARSSINNDEIL